MKHLPVDKRGFPIPIIILRDLDGQPMFVANDGEVSRKCVLKKLCPICGERLTKELWFVGGPKAAFHPNGSYYDSAMHHECMTFALQVCPYLAMPNWHSTSEVQRPHLQERAPGPLRDITMEPGKPPVFVAVMAYGQSLTYNGRIPYIHPLRPYHSVEFWINGRRLSYAEGLEVVQNLPKLKPTEYILSERKGGQ